MQQSTLGKKIRELRLQKNMTQAALAGDTITRNMLSQIENGSAQPSVTTIVELAEKLGAPTEYFFSQTNDLQTFRKLESIGKIRKLYAARDYGKTISRLESLGVWDDETEYLYAQALFHQGVALYREGALADASDSLQKALLHAENTLYADEIFVSLVRKYLCMIAIICNRTNDAQGMKDDVWMADIAYIAVLFGDADSFRHGDTHPLYAEHLTVHQAMRGERTAQNRKTMMQKLKDILSQADETRDAVLRYYVLSDLEILAEEIGDYKCAYECSSARLGLSKKMNH